MIGAVAARSDACEDDRTGSVFHHEGEFWTLAYEGKTVFLRDAKGLRCLAHLLRHPGRLVHVADLAAAGAEPRRALPWRDEREQGLMDLGRELDEAQTACDVGRAARLDHEIEMNSQEIFATYAADGTLERLRKAITNQIRRSLRKIRTEHPVLGRHLENGLRTGSFCSYTPERPVDWTL